MTYFNWILKIIFQYMMLVLCTQCETFNIEIPMKTSFSCLNKTAGFYADINANCKIYHTCDEYGNKFTYYCPKETAFRQDALICDHAHLVHCQEDTFFNTTKYNEEKKHNTSLCTVNSTDRSQSLFHPFHITQSMKTNDKKEQEFVFSPRQLGKNCTKAEPTKNNIRNGFYSLNYINTTTSIPIERSINDKTQYMPTMNHRENGLTKSENFSVQSQNFYDMNKPNGKPEMNKHDYPNQQINDALHNFLKHSLNTFSGTIQTQENNLKNYQSTKSPNNFLKLSSNYPYLETLKSIQKNTKIPSTPFRTTATNIALTTTELPVYALTLSLKPLIPGELEYDPYYPKVSTTTEPYYTPTHNIKEWSYTGDSIQTTWSTTNFELPSVLPDLNSLEDIVDRRKLLYIPRIKFN